MTYLNKYLCIGGCADGEWIETYSRHADEPIIIPVPVKIEISRDVELIDLKLETHQYHPEYFRSEGVIFKIYRFNDLPKELLFEKLLQGYKPT